MIHLQENTINTLTMYYVEERIYTHYNIASLFFLVLFILSSKNKHLSVGKKKQQSRIFFYFQFLIEIHHERSRIYIVGSEVAHKFIVIAHIKIQFQMSC